MTVDQDVARAARGLFSTKPPSYMHKLAEPQKPEPLKLQDDPDWLRARAREGLTLVEIAGMAGCSHSTIKNRMRQYHIVSNTRLTKKRGLWLDKTWLHQKRVVERMTCDAMAKLAGCAYSTILYELKRQGIYDGHIRHGPSVAPVEAVPVAEPELHIHRWWERDDEREEPILDCLDCPETVTSCAGCANNRD